MEIRFAVSYNWIVIKLYHGNERLDCNRNSSRKIDFPLLCAQSERNGEGEGKKLNYRYSSELTQLSHLIPFCLQASHHHSKHQIAIFVDQAHRTAHCQCGFQFSYQYYFPSLPSQICNYKIVECVCGMNAKRKWNINWKSGDGNRIKKARTPQCGTFKGSSAVETF